MIKITKSLLSRWFKVANTKYFNNEIEKEPDYVISTNKSRFGQFSCGPNMYSIEISTAYICSERDYMNTFLHELCHLYVRQKYGRVQSHGKEWKYVANLITMRTKGKYGIIQRVGGHQDKCVLRGKCKVSNFVIFTDYTGRFAVAKYNNAAYPTKLKKMGAVLNNTKMYYIQSDNKEMAEMKLRSANARGIYWTYPKKFTLDELLNMSRLVNTETYCQTA